MKKHFAFLFCLAVAGTVAVTALPEGAAACSAKTYQLKDLRQVVSNSTECKSLLSGLRQWAKKPVSLQFYPASRRHHHTVKNVSGAGKNHSHKTAEQTIKGGKIHRTGLGSFELNGKKYDYVLEIAGNIDNPRHKYLYPIILFADDAQCYYTALLEPDAKTAQAFRESIASGAAAKGTDLHRK